MDILLLGPQKSGKTSIQRVVFQKMSPHETFFLPPTSRVDLIRVANNPNIQFNIKDFPGKTVFNAEDPNDKATLKNCGALIFVIDAQLGEIEEACAQFREIIIQASKVNKLIFYEVFIHKVDTDLFASED